MPNDFTKQFGEALAGTALVDTILTALTEVHVAMSQALEINKQLYAQAVDAGDLPLANAAASGIKAAAEVLSAASGAHCFLIYPGYSDDEIAAAKDDALERYKELYAERADGRVSLSTFAADLIRGLMDDDEGA